ncbi:MAG: UDP-N-acetyl-D-mannosamine dehydrogenase [Arachnia sp.]
MSEFESETVAVLGLGYIGLPTAAILATHGMNVIGVDVDPQRVNDVNAGQVPFVEPDLRVHVGGAVAAGRLRAQHETPPADIYIIAVPTPFQKDHKADLRFVDAAADSIVPQLSGGELIIVESTSPPGTTAHVADRVMAARPDLTIDPADGRPVVEFAHCPERVLPGRVMIELVTNDRIVGGLTREASMRARDLYRIFCDGEIHLTTAATAELAKLAENAYRDVNIAFANELSIIADQIGVNVFELIAVSNRHPRVNILQPGPGVGGHCIAVDPWFIVGSAPEYAPLVRAARAVNDGKPHYVVEQINDAVAGLTSPTIALLGLAFKPDIDDLRESPAFDIALSVARIHPTARVLAVEPNVRQLPPQLAQHPNVELTDLSQALAQAEVIALLVDHQEFKRLDRSQLPEVPIIDTRGTWHGHRR